jgi:antitoxin component YwqK of YwqJK toxin-antitoxin module
LWYENGQKLSEVIFKKGNKDGKWVDWNKNGSVREVIEY